MYPPPSFSRPSTSTFAAFTAVSIASMTAVSPCVSIMPMANGAVSLTWRSLLSGCMSSTRGKTTTSCSISGLNSGFASYAPRDAGDGAGIRSVTHSASIPSATARPAARAASTSDVEPMSFTHAPYRSLIST